MHDSRQKGKPHKHSETDFVEEAFGECQLSAPHVVYGMLPNNPTRRGLALPMVSER